MTTATVAERVERGAEWLDANVPDWADRVTLPTFDIGNACRCVLGQVFAADGAAWVTTAGRHFPLSGFDYALGAFDDSDDEFDWAAALGFDAAPDPRGDETLDFTALQAEWTRLIADRQAAKVSA